MFQEYINNVISSRESTRGFVMITLRAKMRLYVSRSTIRIRQFAAATSDSLLPHFVFPTVSPLPLSLFCLSLVLPVVLSRKPRSLVLLRFTKIYYRAFSKRALSRESEE